MHISELASGRRINHPQEVVSVGDQVAGKGAQRAHAMQPVGARVNFVNMEQLQEMDKEIRYSAA